MLFASQFSDDQIAIVGCAIVFGGCLVMMWISQKVGNVVRGQQGRTRAEVVPFPTTSQESARDRKAA